MTNTDKMRSPYEDYESNMLKHYTLEQLKERNAFVLRDRAMPSEYLIQCAINETEYKYFGDYEMSADQVKAVDILVDCAVASASLLPALEAAREALKSCHEEYNEYLDFKGADGMEQFFDKEAVAAALLAIDNVLGRK